MASPRIGKGLRMRDGQNVTGAVTDQVIGLSFPAISSLAILGQRDVNAY
jgi:hypothetical protein